MFQLNKLAPVSKKENKMLKKNVADKADRMRFKDILTKTPT